MEITFGLFADGKEEYTLITKDGEQPYKSNIYEIGSITKTVTGLLAARAILAGKLSPDDRVNKYITELDSQKKWPTFRHLLTHTSGIDDEALTTPEEMTIFETTVESELPFANFTREELIRRINTCDLSGEDYPWNYSNFGTALAGVIIERVENKSYEDLINELFEEKGLHEMSLFKYDDERIIQGVGKEGGQKGNFRWSPDMAIASAGALYSTPEDLMKYGKIMLEVATEDVRYALKPQGVVSVEGNVNIGSFWLLYDKYGVCIHNGGTGCFNCILGIDREAKAVMIVLSNVLLKDDLSIVVRELYKRRVGE